NIVSGGNIWGVGLEILAWSTVTYSSVTTTGVKALVTDGSNNTISYSSAAATSGNVIAVYTYTSSNTFTNDYLSNIYIDGGHNNLVDLSTISANNAGYKSLNLYGNYNTIKRSYIGNDGWIAAAIVSDNNTIDGSTIATPSNYAALDFSGAASKFNTVSNSFIS